MNKLEQFFSGISIKEYVFIILFLVCFYPAISIGLTNPLSFETGQAKEQVIVLLFGLILLVSGLSLNARKSFPYAAILLLFYQFVSIIQLNFAYALPDLETQNPALKGFSTSRNIILLLLVIYLVLHFIIHPIKFLLNRKHKIVTKEGLILSTVICIAVLWNFFFASLVTDILGIFVVAYS